MSTTMSRRARIARAAAPAPILAALLLAHAGCDKHEGGPVEAAAAVSLATETVAAVRETDFVEAVGTLKAAREATIASKVMGTVTEITKRAGDPVREGEILVVIDSRDVAGHVAQAEGALAQAKAAATLSEANYRRFHQLHERGSASALELDQARYHYDTALGAVKQAEGALAAATSYEAYAKIPAPFRGRVVDRLCEVGELAAPGRPILKIEDTRRLRLFASLEASRAGAAKVGKKVEVFVPEIGDQRFQGTIREVTPSADPATRSILVKIDLEESPALAGGLYGRARIPQGERDVIRVPASAVVRRGSLTGVFVNVEGRAAFRMITLADSDAERPEVLSGISTGDVIVVDPPPTLAIGTRLAGTS